MTCRCCGKTIGLLRRIVDKEFCSEGHRRTSGLRESMKRMDSLTEEEQTEHSQLREMATALSRQMAPPSAPQQAAQVGIELDEAGTARALGQLTLVIPAADQRIAEEAYPGALPGPIPTVEVAPPFRMPLVDLKISSALAPSIPPGNAVLRTELPETPLRVLASIRVEANLSPPRLPVFGTFPPPVVQTLPGEWKLALRPHL